jgi:ATP-dependent helicase HrpB
LRARRARRLGSLVLTEQVKQVTPNEDTARILAHGLIGQGLDRLDWSKAALQFRTRVGSLRKAEGDEWPDLSNDGLARNAADWLEPLLADKTARNQLSAGELFDAISNLVPWNLRRRLDAEAPTHFVAPTGTAVPIDYEAEQGPTVSIRLQELFGLTQHPSIAGGRVALVIELLSPGHKPVQITRDLPGFWRGSYADVRADLRGRYPRHPWPEDPTSAPPTRRAKPRGT